MNIFSDIYARLIGKAILIPVLLAAIFACEQVEQQGPKRVFIVYSIGYNNLSSYLKEDIEDLEKSYSSIGGNNHVVVFSHSTKGKSNYTTPNPPVVFSFRKLGSGKVVRDTLLVMEPNTVSASAETLREVLTFIQDRYQEAEYSILFSSHGTGWAPADYCNRADEYENSYSGLQMRMGRQTTGREPYWGVVPEDGGPVVKSFGVQNITSNTYHEMDITDMADAFPMKVKTLIFDACFMGGIETAYELSDVAQTVIASQTEILADGMDYTSMLKYIFRDNLKGFCENYFNYYNSKSGAYQSATISMIDCSRLEPLARICREIFEIQREQIASLEGSYEVQRYYRRSYSSEHKWFYDLEDIIMHTEASEEQIEALKTALEGCVTYKAATEHFINDITITAHSGLSMYLPYADRRYLNDFYKTLKWNKATNLVR